MRLAFEMAAALNTDKILFLNSTPCCSSPLPAFFSVPLLFLVNSVSNQSFFTNALKQCAMFLCPKLVSMLEHVLAPCEALKISNLVVIPVTVNVVDMRANGNGTIVFTPDRPM